MYILLSSEACFRCVLILPLSIPCFKNKDNIWGNSRVNVVTKCLITTNLDWHLQYTPNFISATDCFAFFFCRWQEDGFIVLFSIQWQRCSLVHVEYRLFDLGFAHHKEMWQKPMKNPIIICTICSWTGWKYVVISGWFVNNNTAIYVLALNDR